MERLSFSYHGYFNDSIAGQMSELLDSALTEYQFDRRTRTKVKALMVEQIQNIQRYSRHPRVGSVKIGQEEDHFFVETVNAIDPDRKEDIASQLADLARTSAETLRKKYRAAMREPLAAGDQGSGLGLLFLLRQSSRALSYSFVRRTDQDLYFQLKSYVN